MDRLRTFFKGAIPGLLGFVALLDVTNNYWTAVVKIGGIILIPILTGILTVLGNDFYKYKIKNKLFSDGNKKSGGEGDEKAA